MDPTPQNPQPAAATPETPKSVCPFCGTIVAAAVAPCPTCGLQDTAETRAATKVRIGPWSVLQKRNPSAPGMNFATLSQLIQNGKVNAHSIIRGPTTHQFWQFAGTVRGVSRLLNVCHHCGLTIDAQVETCPRCGAARAPPDHPDALLDLPKPPSYALVKVRDGMMSVESAPAMEKAAAQASRRTPTGMQRPREGLMPVDQLAEVFRTTPAVLPVVPAAAKRSRPWGVWVAVAVILVVGGLLTIFHFATRNQSPIPMPAASTAPATPLTPQTPPAETTDTSGYQLAEQLMATGLEAEQRKDYSSAQYYYEQIEQLPPQVWPPEVDRRLQIVKKLAAGGGDQQ